MSDNPGIIFPQAFGNRELEDTTFTRPGTVLPSFVPPVIGYHQEGDIEHPNGPGYKPKVEQNRRSTNPQNRMSNPGILIEGFYDLFWKNRLHIIANSFDAGNILSPVQNSFEIYNSGTRIGQDVHSVTSLSNLTGIGVNIVGGNETFPYQLGLNESEVYTYQIETSGPATLSGQYDVAFDNGLTLVHTITGSRILFFDFLPQEAFKEKWSWVTDIHRKVDGSEQRISVRNIPRQTFEHLYQYSDEEENRRLENVMAGRLPVLVGLPVHKDLTLTTVTVNSGDTTITVGETAERQFQAGQSAVLFNPATLLSEILEIASFTATTISFQSQVLNGWPVGSEVLPVALANIQLPIKQTLFMVNVKKIPLVFEVEENFETPDTSDFSLYNGKVLWDYPLLVPNLTYGTDFDFNARRFDGVVGRTFTSAVQDAPTKKVALHIVRFENRTEMLRIRDLIMALRGRQKSFYMTSQRQDFVPNIVGTTTPTDRCNMNISEFAGVFEDGWEKHIEIEYADGSIDRREVIAVAQISGYEELQVDSNISQDFNPSNVSRVSIIKLVRLDLDTVEFRYDWFIQGEIGLTFVETKD